MQHPGVSRRPHRVRCRTRVSRFTRILTVGAVLTIASLVTTRALDAQAKPPSPSPAAQDAAAPRLTDHVIVISIDVCDG
jgi:hypothetical protein